MNYEQTLLEVPELYLHAQSYIAQFGNRRKNIQISGHFGRLADCQNSTFELLSKIKEGSVREGEGVRTSARCD